MAVIEIRDDNSFLLFKDSEGWNQSIRKNNIALRVDNRSNILKVYDGVHKWFDIDPLKVTRPSTDGTAEDLRKEVEQLLDDNQFMQRRSPNWSIYSRLFVSQERYLSENIFEYSEEPKFWDVVENVNGTVNFNAFSVSAGLSIGTAQGDKLIRQTRQFYRYSSGKVSRAKFGILFEPPKAGLRQRIGKFYEDNGIFLEIDENGEYWCVRRTNASGSVSEERVKQQDWNVDPFDGTGRSREAVDFSKIQMVEVRYGWYGAGSGTVTFIVRGEAFPVHHFDAGNRLSEPLFGRPTLPIRHEIENVTATASPSEQRLFGSTVSDDGGESTVNGRTFIASMTSSNPFDDTGFTPILSVRPKLSIEGVLNRTTIEILQTQLQTDINLAEYKLIHDGTLTGASWVDDSEFTQQDTAATAVTFQQKDIIGGGYIGARIINGAVDVQNSDVRFPFTINHDGTTQNFITIALRAISNQNGNGRALVRGIARV